MSMISMMCLITMRARRNQIHWKLIDLLTFHCAWKSSIETPNVLDKQKYLHCKIRLCQQIHCDMMMVTAKKIVKLIKYLLSCSYLNQLLIQKTKNACCWAQNDIFSWFHACFSPLEISNLSYENHLILSLKVNLKLK